jgi:hypothetical protein
MTIHVPRWFLFGVLGLAVLAAAGYGGLRVGDQRGADAQRDHDATRSAAKLAAASEQAEAALMTHHKYELYMLRATCQYTAKLRDSVTGRSVGTPFGCNGITPPPGDHITIYGHDARMTDVLGQICESVAAATGVNTLSDGTNCRPDPNDVRPLESPKELQARVDAALAAR